MILAGSSLLSIIGDFFNAVGYVIVIIIVFFVLSMFVGAAGTPPWIEG